MDTATPPKTSRCLVIRPLVVGLVVTAIGIAAVLGLRAVYTDHYEETRHYASAAAIPSPNGVFVLPSWAPDDATDITFHVQTQGHGRSIVLTTSAGRAQGCRPAPAPSADPVPALDLPGDLRSSPGERCDRWFVAREGTALYAWEAYR